MKSLVEYIYERGPAPKVDLKKHAIVLLDTYNYSEEEDNDIDVLIDDFNEQIEKANKEYEGFLITGTLGLWHGKKDIYPEYCADLNDAYTKCVENADDIIVKIVDGALEISSMHHDGTNTLYIRPLDPIGCDIISNFEQGYEDDYFEGLNDDEFYKKFLKDSKLFLKFEPKDFDL